MEEEEKEIKLEAGDDFLTSETKNNLFIDREILRSTYLPDALPHREKEINKLTKFLIPALRGEKSPNIFVYGKDGIGKTAVAKFVGKELLKKGEETGKHVNFVYINCEIVDTQYRLLQNITNHFINEWTECIPFTGWPTDEVYAKLRQMIDKNGGVTVIILDEVDKLKGDEALYTLSRMNSDLEKAKVSIVGISDDLKFTEFLDPKVKHSLAQEILFFSPYTESELQDILKQRVTMALQPNSINDDVIPLCSALAAQEHGDARRAFNLLRVSVEIAERNRAPKVTKKHVKLAQNKIELDRILEVVYTLPTQSKLVLSATLLKGKQKQKGKIKVITVEDVYETYKKLCEKTKTDLLTKKRVATLISELEMLGVFSTSLISKREKEQTREIIVSNALLKNINLEGVTPSEKYIYNGKGTLWELFNTHYSNFCESMMFNKKGATGITAREFMPVDDLMKHGGRYAIAKTLEIPPTKEGFEKATKLVSRMLASKDTESAFYEICREEGHIEEEKK